MLTYKQWTELSVNNIVPPEDFPQIKHLDAHVDIDFKNKQLSNVVTYYCHKYPFGSDALTFDAVDFEFDYIKVNNKLTKYEYDGKKVIVNLDKKIVGEFQLQASYKVKPKLGMYFIQNEDYLECWTQGENTDNRYWLLCIDYPNQKFTATIAVSVPKEYTAISNGRLVEVKQIRNKSQFLYKMGWAVTSYLIAIAAGKFAKHSEKADGITLNYYYPPTLKKLAENSFKETPKILKFFNEKIKYKYPEESYSQVIITSFMYGGMENTTTTFLTEFFIFDDTVKEFLEEYARGLLAHEFAHQWWGDTLTCKNWKHIWLNESFATYWDALYTENQKGADEFAYQLVAALESYLDESKMFQRPIVPQDFVDPSLMFDRHTYPKGALVLHTLRNYVGDQVFFESLTHYINKNQHKCVETKDLISAFEEVAGKDLNEFFDTWVFKGGHPQIELKYLWNQKEKLVTIKLEQVQDTNTTPIYKLNLPIKFYKVKADKASLIKEDVINLTLKQENFYFKLDEEPAFFEIDPEFTSLKTLKINYTNKELENVIKHSRSYYTNYLFFNNIQTATYSDELVNFIIKKITTKEIFFGTKLLAVSALENFPTIYVENKLKEIYGKIENSRVKNQIVKTLSTFKSQENLNFFKDILIYEKNPYILGSALIGIANLDLFDEDKSEAIKTIKRYLDFQSIHNIVSMNAYRALGKLKDEKSIQDLVAGYKKAKHRYVKIGIVDAFSEYSVYDNYISDKAIFYLKKLLVCENDIIVRRAILNALSKFSANKVTAILQSAVESELYSGNRIAAKMSLERVKSMDKKADVAELKKEIEKIKFENKLLKEKVETLEQKNKRYTNK